MRFCQPRQGNFDENTQVLAPGEKIVKFFLIKDLFHAKVPIDTQNLRFPTLAENFWQKTFRSIPQIDEKSLVLTDKETLFGTFWWTRRTQFRHKPVSKIFAKVQQFSRHVQKWWKKLIIFPMKFFPQNVLVDTMIALLTIRPKRSQLKDRTFRSLC